MDGRRSWVRVALSMPVLVLAVVLLWPAHLGGATNYVIVTGESMEPTYRDGDLVIARVADRYEVGDVVTFDAPDASPGIYHVIHRVVAITADGYVTQGDNRDEIDEWTPADVDILGASELHLPRVGLLARGLQRNPAFTLAFGTGLLVLTTGGARRLKRRRRQSTPQDIAALSLKGGSDARPTRRRLMSATTTSKLPIKLAGPAWAPPALAATLALTLVLGWTTFQAMSAEPTVDVSTTTAYDTTFAYGYTANAQPSRVYPEGQVGPVTAPEEAEPVDLQQVAELETDPELGATGIDGDTGHVPVAPPQALYTGLVDQLDVTIEAAVGADGAEVEVTGDHRAELVVTSADGWTEAKRFGPADGVALDESGRAMIEGSIDIDEVLGLLREVENLTGTSALPASVEVVSTVEMAGTVDGRQVDDEVTSGFAVEVGSSTLAPSTVLLRAGQDAVVEEASVAATFAGLPLPAARGLFAGALVASLLGLAALAAMVLTGWRRPEHEAIAARHGALIITVDADPVRGATPMPVDEIGDLVRLARREQTCILHERRDGGGHRYVVPDGLMAFIYETLPSEAATAPETASGTMPPMDADGPATVHEVLVPGASGTGDRAGGLHR